ncbi:MAG: GlsB/YeaQ/YmgE family stress response membrane protein [Anaerolineales bacterium]|nr:GlsB/YeaQ/YmgE family stress response membrane protein [Anaerolineales bacterium]
MSILIWIISGILAGWLAGVIVKGNGFGLLGDLIVGLIGGVIGGWLAGLLGLQAGSWLGQILVAALGGVVFVVILRAIRRL